MQPGRSELRSSRVWVVAFAVPRWPIPRRRPRGPGVKTLSSHQGPWRPAFDELTARP